MSECHTRRESLRSLSCCPPALRHDEGPEASVCVCVHKHISLLVCLQAIQSDDVFFLGGGPFWAESVLFLPLCNAHNAAHTAQEINNICLSGGGRGGHKKFLENILPPLVEFAKDFTLALHNLPSFFPSPTIRNSPTGPELIGSSGDVRRCFAIHAAGMQRPGMQMSWGGEVFFFLGVSCAAARCLCIPALTLVMIQLWNRSVTPAPAAVFTLFSSVLKTDNICWYSEGLLLQF